MVVELSQISNASIRLTNGQKLATVDRVIFDGEKAQIVGFQTAQRAVITRFSRLDFDQTLSVGRGEVVIDDQKNLQRDLKLFDQLRHQYGHVIGVAAKTEAGQSIGKITDLLIDGETGLIVRFYLNHYLRERIIPRQFLVSITPRQIIFKDIVNQPIFDQVATAGATSAG